MTFDVEQMETYPGNTFLFVSRGDIMYIEKYDPVGIRHWWGFDPQFSCTNSNNPGVSYNLPVSVIKGRIEKGLMRLIS